MEKKLKHQEEQKLKIVKIGRLSIYYLFPYEILNTYKEIFVEEIYKFHALREDPFIIDCGANIGLSVIYFKSIYPKATITAFEPDITNADIFEKNIVMHQLKNITLVRAAVWNKADTLSFYSTGSQGSKIAADHRSPQQPIQVKAIRLADLLQQTQVDFLKIDIEGAEFEVLQDCGPFLSNVQNIFLEYHGKDDSSDRLITIVKILKENKFSIYFKMADDKTKQPFIKRVVGEGVDVQINIFAYRTH
ncbi:MAG: hypothetical protein NVS9B7_22010 [Flavisolibacter sp.]